MWNFRIFLLFWSLVIVSSLSARQQVDTLYNQPYDWSAGERENLPDWIFGLHGKDEVIAMSDPCLKPFVAREQAIIRALFLHSMQEGASIQLLFDYFSSVSVENYEKSADKMLAMAVLQQPLKKCSYKILNEYISAFGEVYVHLKVLTEPEKSDEMSCSYQSFAELMFVHVKEYQEKYEIKMQLEIKALDLQQIRQTGFSVKGYPSNLKIDSSINRKALYSLPFSYYYQSNLEERPQNCHAISLQESFWNAYINSFLKALLTYNYPSVTIKSVSETYGDGHAQNSELSRETITSNLTMTPHLRGIVNDKLYIEWLINLLN